jgi:hypothetical protein
MDVDNVQFSRRHAKDAKTSTTYSYPYDNLPKLKSHLHPRFAIFDAGRKLRKLGEQSPEDLEKVLKNNSGLEKIIMLYNAWIRPPPTHSQANVSYYDPNQYLEYISEEDDNGGNGEEDGNGKDDPEDSEFDEGRTYRTKLGRGDGWVLRSRSLVAGTNRLKSGPGGPRTQEGQNAPAAVKRRKVLPKSRIHNRQLLSKATLFSFNRQCGDAVWTSDRIRHWSRTISKKKLVSRLRHPPIRLRSSHLSS